MNTYVPEEKPKKLTVYTIFSPEPWYFEVEDDRTEAIRQGREKGATVTECHLRLDRWGAFYDTVSKEEIMTDGRPVKPSLDDWGADE